MSVWVRQSVTDRTDGLRLMRVCAAAELAFQKEKEELKRLKRKEEAERRARAQKEREKFERIEERRRALEEIRRVRIGWKAATRTG